MTTTKYNTDYKSIGQRIKEAREAKPMTQAELANKMGGWSTTYISTVENNHQIPTVKAIRVFEKALGCKLTK